jgi:hypothetical protein
MQVITRAEAIAQDLKQYYERPCRHGHAEGFYVSSQSCVTCDKARSAEWRRKHPEKVSAYSAEYRKSGRNIDAVRRWRAANPERNRELQGHGRRLKSFRQKFADTLKSPDNERHKFTPARGRPADDY